MRYNTQGQRNFQCSLALLRYKVVTLLFEGKLFCIIGQIKQSL